MVGGLGYLGAGLGGISQGYSQGYDQSLQQQGQLALGRTLQMLGQAPQMQPMPTGPQPPQHPPMGGGMPQQPPQQMAGPVPNPQGSPPVGVLQGGGMPPPQMPQRMAGGPMGQPAMSAGQPPAAMMPQGGQGQPQMQGPTGWGGGMPDIGQVVAMIARANPEAPPQVLSAATEHYIKTFMPIQLRDQALQQAAMLGFARIGAQNYRTDVGADTAGANRESRERIAADNREAADTRSQRTADTADKNREQKKEQFNEREARITAHQMITTDQAWARLNQQRQQAEQRMKQSGDKQAITQWRAILDAQHKRAQEIINAYSANTTMPKEVRDKLLKDADQAYEDGIKQMSKGDKASFSDRFPGGGQPSP